MEEILWVCPKCRAIKSGAPTDKCSVCKCSVCNTGVSFEDYLDWEDDEQERWEKEMIAKYAPNPDGYAMYLRSEHDESSGTFVPKCPTCGHYARALSNIESSIPFALEHSFNSKKAGKSFICDHCGYTW